LSLTQFCFSVRQAEAGLRSSPKKVAVGRRRMLADRVRGQSGLRPVRRRTGHGSRSTAELAGLVPSPSASSPSPALGMKYPDNDILGEFGGAGTALGYDGAGRLSSIPGILSSVTYNALGAPLVQTNANGTTTTKTYDANRFWLTDIDTSAPSLTLQNLQYTLNDAGMATAVDSDVTNETWAYAYDELNRLTSSTNGVGANDQSWTYDAIGRFTANSRVGSSFNYPGVGNARPHAPTQISGGPLGLLTFAYDANGNMTSGNGRSMSWNPENMITQVVANSRTTTFTYGPDGDRIKKAEGSTVLRYPFGDDYEIATDGTVTKYFDAGFGPIAKKVGGTLYWLHTDRLGSINATTDDTGAQVLRRSFRSYGELLGQTGTHAESLGYIGQRTDEETANGTTDDKGLTYLHARYYDSALGTFLSPDPISADRNTYRYSFGDSVNFSDASGLNPQGVPWVNPCMIWAALCRGEDVTVVGVGGQPGGADLPWWFTGGAPGSGPVIQPQIDDRCILFGECEVAPPDQPPVPQETCEERNDCPVKTCQEERNCPLALVPIVPPYETPVPTEAKRLRNGIGLILLGEAVHQAGNRLPCGAFRANARGVSTLINAAAAVELGLSAARIGLTLAAVPHPAATIVGGGLVVVGVAVSGGFALSQAIDDMWDPTCG